MFMKIYSWTIKLGRTVQGVNQSSFFLHFCSNQFVQHYHDVCFHPFGIFDFRMIQKIFKSNTKIQQSREIDYAALTEAVVINN